MFPGSYRGAGPYNSSSAPRPPPQKYGVPLCGMGASVPSLTTITNSQELQWMVQPTVITTSPSNLYPRTYPYPHMGMNAAPGPSGLSRAGVIRAIMPPLVGRRRKEEELSPEEEERKRLRRERNKLAAAKCRNRRRELTDRLQSETDQLEDVKSGLQKEIAELQKEKERLEFILEAHQPICKIPDDGRGPSTSGTARGREVKPKDPGLETANSSQRPKPPRVSLRPVRDLGLSRGSPEPEVLHTPTLLRTPSVTPFTASLAFTYPSLPAYDPEPSAGPSSQGMSLFTPPEACAAAHRRGSSSGDQSSDSLSSPTLVTL